MKSFDDFMDSFTQDDIDEAIREISESVLEREKTLYTDLSDSDRMMSKVADLSVNLALTLLGRYHEWVNQDKAE